MVQSGEHLCEDLRPISSSHEMLERRQNSLELTGQQSRQGLQASERLGLRKTEVNGLLE